MSILPMVTVGGIILVIALMWLFLRTRNSDQMEVLLNQRKGTSRVCGLAHFVEGMEHIPVALSMDDKNIFYENPDLQAQLEIARIDEVEYDDELTTGKAVSNGRVLRLRSHGQTFEFILDTAHAQKWTAILPAHRMGEPGSVHSV